MIEGVLAPGAEINRLDLQVLSPTPSLALEIPQLFQYTVSPGLFEDIIGSGRGEEIWRMESLSYDLQQILWDE